MKYLDNYDEKQALEAWFALILRNAFRDYMKQERGVSTEEIDEFDHEGARCDGLVRRMWNEIQGLIDTYPENQKEILTLHFVQEYTASDISKFTNNTLSNAYQVINRFRNKIRKEYGKMVT